MIPSVPTPQIVGRIGHGSFGGAGRTGGSAPLCNSRPYTIVRLHGVQQGLAVIVILPAGND
jgi:hypothetical protein